MALQRIFPVFILLAFTLLGGTAFAQQHASIAPATGSQAEAPVRGREGHPALQRQTKPLKAKQMLRKNLRKMKKAWRDIMPGSNTVKIGWILLIAGVILLGLGLMPIFVGKAALGSAVILGGACIIAGIIGIILGG